MTESQILCEGYHDRAFWAGWLRHLGCRDPGAPPVGSSRRRTILDPWNTPVAGGQFAYESPAGHFLRVVPCQGRSQILPLARDRLIQRARKPLARLVINVDADTTAGGVRTTTGLRVQDVESYVRTHVDPAAARNPSPDIEIDGGQTLISLVRWEVSDPSDSGLPDQQTLERLLCAAISAAYPARKSAVGCWLTARPAPPPPSPKDHAWSHMAGWYAEHGCESFYGNLWNDPLVVRELEARLTASGASQIAATLAR